MELDYDQLVALSTEVGHHLLESGAEIYRVEESVQRILEAYGAESGQVFVIPSCVIVSLCTPGGHPVTQLRRVRAVRTDIHLLEAYNGLCRRLCRERPAFPEAQEQVRKIQLDRVQYSFPATIGAYLLSTAAFSLFYGGTLRDGLCGGLCGGVICLCLTFMTRLGANAFFKTIAGAAASALLAQFLTWTGLGQNVNFITIGALMALVPGVTFTNAIRDIMAGDLIAGISKVAEALLIGAAIALGTGFTMILARALMGVG